MFEDADHFADLFRGGLPYYLLITLPILIICSSNPVLAASEFGVQRMAQYDVHGVAYGCRASALNMEAKSLYSWQTSRHCVVTRFQDMTIDQFREIRSKAGGLVILLPDDVSSLSLEEKQHILLLEQAMLSQEISIPVYFSRYNSKMNEIINDITRTTSKQKQQQSSSGQQQQRESAIGEILSSISANGYQVVVSGSTHAANKQSKIPIIQGELAPPSAAKAGGAASDSESKLPLIIITAHLDTFGLLPSGTSTSTDVATLLALMELFSKLHASAPKYRLMFVVSESGLLLNFQGTKKWLDTTLDENAQSFQQAVEFVVCLDTVGKLLAGDGLYMHVSRPPKEGTPTNAFYRLLKQSAQRFGNITVEGVHKKINLADTLLVWEHERFSMRRLPAFTISNVKSHKDPLRTTIFDEQNEDVLLDKLELTVKILAETLAAYIYSLPTDQPAHGDAASDDDAAAATVGEIFTGSMAITRDTIRPWLVGSSTSRGEGGVRSAQQNNDLRYAFEKYLRNVRVSQERPDTRDPDFMLYDDRAATLNLYHVKPAVFDLFLTLLIIAYLSVVYFAIYYFPAAYGAVCRLTVATAGSASSFFYPINGPSTGKTKVN